MTNQALPKKLKKEPLIEAVFEIRFSAALAASSVLPGFFFAKLGAKTVVEPLPIAQVPPQIRDIDPNLRYQPLMKINWDNFIILIGDKTLGIACTVPYPGWTNFREKIVEVIRILIDSDIVQNVERYSIKYVDIIEGEDLAKQIERVALDILIGTHRLKEENFTVRVEIPHENFINAIQIAAPASAKIPNAQERKGVLVAIDTVCNYQTSDLSEFMVEFIDRLDQIHNETEKTFFDCLKPETLAYLEAVYE